MDLHIGYETVDPWNLKRTVHGAPRYTGDLDLCLRPTPENARNVLAALDAFGVDPTA